MTIDQLFSDLGVNLDSRGVKKFVAEITAATKEIRKSVQQLVDVVTDATKEIKKKTSDASDGLDKVALSTVDAVKKTAKQAQAAIEPLIELKRIASSIGSAVSSAATSVFSFVTSGVEGAKKLAKEKGLLYDITEEELKQADEYAKSMGKAQQSVELMKTKVALGLAPALTEISDGFNQWLDVNKELVAEGLTTVIRECATMIKVIANTLKSIDRAVSSTIGWKAALMIIVGALAIVKRAILAAFVSNPIGWVIAAISGLIWIIDDLMIYLKDGKSTFGGFWEPAVKWIRIVISWWKKWLDSSKESINRVKDIFSRVFSGLWAIVSNFFSYLSNTLGLIYGLLTGNTELVSQSWRGMVKAIEGMWGGVKTYFSAWFDWFKTVFGTALVVILSFWEGLKASFQKTWDVVGNLANQAAKRIEAAFSGAIDFMASPFQSAVNIIKGLFEAAGGDADKFIDDIKQTFNNVIDAITEPFKKAFAEIMEIYEKTIGKISGACDSVKGGASGAWDSVKNGASGVFESAKGWLNLGDATSAPNPQNSSNNVNNRSEVNIHSEGVKAQITINATNAEEARIGVEAGLEAGYRSNRQMMANLNGVGAQ